MYEALRETAFKERCKIHDLVMQGIELALRRRGYPSVDDLKGRAGSDDARCQKLSREGDGLLRACPRGQGITVDPVCPNSFCK